MENYGSLVKGKVWFGWLVLALLALTVTPHETCAQYYYRPQKKLLLGFEGGVVMRALKMQSDVKQLDQLNLHEEGFNVGVLFGGNAIQSRTRIGIYKSSSTVNQKINIFEFEGGLNFFPAQIKKSRKPNYFRPYLAASIERDKLSFYGSYELPQPEVPGQEECEPAINPGSSAPSGPPGNPGGDPDLTPESQQAPLSDPDREEPVTGDEKKLGQIALSRVNVGVGVMLHIPHDRVFMNLFAEAKYGLPLNQQPSGYGLARTEVLSPLIMNFGISLGIKN